MTNMSDQHFFAAQSLESDLVPWSYISEADSIYIRKSEGVYGLNIDFEGEPGLILDYASQEDAQRALQRLQREHARLLRAAEDNPWFRNGVMFLGALASGLAAKALVMYMAARLHSQQQQDVVYA
jgi:hypothetical protein